MQFSALEDSGDPQRAKVRFYMFKATQTQQRDQDILQAQDFALAA